MNDFARITSRPGIALEVDDDFDRINALCLERGWSDGLPVVPPTEQRVERMLAHCDRAWDEPVAALAPRYAPATPLRLAANAVMAGCRPEYFPVVIAAIEAMADPAFNLYGIQATTHPCSPLILVNGPAARALGINGGANAFGQGKQANAAIGRAVRLALVNIGGAIPQLGDMATQGAPTKYTYCAAENEAESPWEPLHVELGYEPGASTVTVIAAEPPHNINDHESTTADGILKTIAETMAVPGSNNAYHYACPVVAISPEHAATIAAGGYSKAEVKRHLHQHSRVPFSRFSTENVERRLKRKLPEEYAAQGLNATAPLALHAEDIYVIVVGGAGKHSAFIPTFGTTRPVTREIATR
jgi:hypothetical protein